MKRERTKNISIVSFVAMIVVMISSANVSAFEIKNGYVFFDAAEHIDFGLQCPEDRNAYVEAVQSNINDFFASLGFVLPEKPEIDETKSVYENTAAMNDYLKSLPIRFYARSHRVSNEGLTGLALFKSITNPELFYTFAIENQTGIQIVLPVDVFTDGTVGLEEMEVVTGVVKLDPKPYNTPSDPLFHSEER